MANKQPARKLSASKIEDALAKLPGWSIDVERRALFRRFELPDFASAFGLMTRIAILAERQDHHPQWSNVYNRLDIWLTTHDVGGLSDRDVALAALIESFAPTSGAGMPSDCKPLTDLKERT